MGIFGSNQAGQARYSGKLHNLQLTQSVFGTTAPIIFGTRRVAAKLLFYGGFYAVKAKTAGGKGFGGGKNSQQYNYYADVQMAMAAGSAGGGCRGLLSVWDQQGKLKNQGGSYVYTIPSGGGSVTPATGSAPIQMDLGVSKSAPYVVIANDYGSGGVRTLSGVQNVAMAKASGTPGAGQYSFNPSTGSYGFSGADAGAQVTISYSSVFSLYYFDTTQAAEIPNVGPYQISTNNQPYYYSDGGVIRVDTGAALVRGVDYSVGSGVYTFSSSLAGVYVYIKYTFTSSDSSVTNSSKLNLTFFGGTLSQAPNSYWQSKYPGAAFGYTGLCHVDANPMALGNSAALPSYNYEVVGLDIFPGGGLDAHFCDAFRTLLYDAYLGVGFPSANVDAWTSCYAYWAANGYLGSMTLDTQTSVADAMSQVIETGNVAAVWSEGKLKLIPYGDATCVGNGYTYTPNTTPVAVLTTNDLLPPSEVKAGTTTASDVIQTSSRAPQDCWNYVQATFCNRANDYNDEPINEQNDAFIHDYGRRMESAQTWDWITSRAAATWALNLRLKRQCYIRNTYRFWLSWRFSYIEAMDLVVLPTGEVVRVTQVTDDADGRLTIEAEQWTYGSGNVTIYPKQDPSSFTPSTSQALPGDTSPVIFEASPQSVLARPNTIQIAAAGNNPAWGGCEVYVSPDGTDYSWVGTVMSLGRTGLLSAPLASAADPDSTHTLSLDMSLSLGELPTVTTAQADAFATLAAIVDPGGAVELISFETATLTAANRYNLTYLRRGVYGTAIGAHAVGAEFSYIGTNGVSEYQYPAQYANKTIYFKFASFNLVGNQMQDVSVVQAYPFTVPGYSLQPPSTGGFSTVPANPLSAVVSGSNAEIDVANFVAVLNGQQVSCTAAGPITGLTQGERWFVYYIDLAFLGRIITPIATQNQADFLGRTGYYVLGSVVTPTTGGGGGGGTGPYRPSNFSDVGSRTTGGPQYAYDADPNTAAGLVGTNGLGNTLSASCVWAGFPSLITSGTKTLTVTLSLSVPSSSNPSTVGVTIAGSFTGLFSSATTTAKTAFTMTVPSGTDLSTISVEADVGWVTTTVGNPANTLQIYDIKVE